MLIAGLLAPAAMLAARFLGGSGPFAALTGRPPGSGSSATRCAQCGSGGHAMLDPDCPAAPVVL